MTQPVQPSYLAAKVVCVVGAVWFLLTALWPEALRWLIHGWGVNEEGPLEAFEATLLALCLLIWLHTSWRLRSRNTAPRVVAVLMVLQLSVLIGEELDWGKVLGFREQWSVRNLRMFLRDGGVIPYFMDAPTMTSFLLCFFLSPAVPSARLRAWWERAAPVRATPQETIALLAAPAAYIVTFNVLGKPPTEMLQTCAYVAVLMMTLRVWQEARP